MAFSEWHRYALVGGHVSRLLALIVRFAPKSALLSSDRGVLRDHLGRQEGADFRDAHRFDRF